MLYNLEEKSNYIQTAGKITIAAALSGILVFAFVFLFNAGKTELLKVEAQTATTTITVLNTPPIWVDFAVEEFESSDDNPTNSGQNISWVALADNSGNAPYFLIVCSGSATPTPTAAADLSSLGTAPPVCISGVQWGVSTATAAMTQARVSTTTTETGAFAGEILDWYAWVCDDDPVNPRCNNTASQGLNATNSSPFHVNFRPTFTAVDSDSPVDPGGVLTFYSTSSDANVVRGPDNIFLYVCNGNDFVPATRTCTSGVLASTSGSVTSDASASFTLPSVIQDSNYDAWVFVVDQYNHAAVGGVHATNEGFTVNNVAPTVPPGTISINNGGPISLSNPAGETTGFVLEFETSDANSCVNTSAGPEMTGYTVSLFRSGLGTTTCTGLPGSYNPNNCYPSSVAPAVWNLSCTASSTTCGGSTDPTIEWSCAFPLWFVADPTDGSSPFSAEGWVAAIAGVDDNNATGTATIGSTPVDLLSFPAIDLITAEIPYGALEPGQNTGTLNATTTILSVGNTGLNQEVQGEAMCPGFAVGSPCADNASSTIPDFSQEFATSSVAYNTTGLNLSSSTPQMLLLRVPKTVSTSTPSQGVTYWGIEVPIEITVAGAYTGLNTFYAVTSSGIDW
jgi:hypothetical protein